MSTGLILAASVAAIAATADCVTTAVALKRGFREANEIAWGIFGNHVVVGSAACYAILIIAAVLMAYVQPVPNDRYAQVFLWVVAAAHLYAAARNVRTIGRHE